MRLSPMGRYVRPFLFYREQATKGSIQNFGVGSIRLQTVVGHSDKVAIRRCGRAAADAWWSFRVRSHEHADARTGREVLDDRFDLTFPRYWTISDVYSSQ
jgi:hypothetical protein